MNEKLYETGDNAKIITFRGNTPQIHESVFLCNGVVIVGEVSIGRDSSVWYNSVIRGDIHYIKIGERTTSNRVKTVQIRTNNGIKNISGSKFRAKVGATKVKSTLFAMKIQGNTLHISGKGYGHGVGMCQWGSKEMAQKGTNYRRILDHFFPGTSISQVSSPLS